MKFDCVLQEQHIEIINEADLFQYAKDKKDWDTFILTCKRHANNPKLLDSYIDTTVRTMRDLSAENIKKYIPMVQAHGLDKFQESMLSKMVMIAQNVLKEKQAKETKVADMASKKEKIRNNQLAYNGVIGY